MILKAFIVKGEDGELLGNSSACGDFGVINLDDLFSAHNEKTAKATLTRRINAVKERVDWYKSVLDAGRDKDDFGNDANEFYEHYNRRLERLQKAKVVEVEISFKEAK